MTSDSSAQPAPGMADASTALDTAGAADNLDTPARRMPLIALYTSTIVSAVGDILMFLAVPWFVLQTTGSVLQTGLVVFIDSGGVAVSALFGGAIVDRIGFRRASILSDLASALCVALIPLLYETVGLPFWGLLALVFLASLVTTPGATARSSMLPELAELAHLRIERAAATSDGMTRLSRFIGGPLAGILIVLLGTDKLLWINAATFAFSAMLIGRFVPAIVLPSGADKADRADEHGKASGGFLGSLRDGFGFLRRDAVLFWLILVLLVTNLLDAGMSGVLVPVFVKEMYGNPVWLGAEMAALGGGAFLGTLIFGAIGHKLPRRLTFGVCFTLGGAVRFFFMVGFAPNPYAVVALLAFCGLFIGAINPIFDTIAYRRIPVALRGRVFGVLMAGSMLGTPLGGLLAGAIEPAVGILASLLIFGAIYFIATSSVLVNPAMRGMDALPEAPVEAAA